MGDVPAYADWVPADDVVVGERGEVFVSSFDVTAMLEVSAEDDQENQGEQDSDEPLPVPFEAFATNALVAVFDWPNLEQWGLAQPILGQSSQDATNNPESTDVPADRQTVVGDTSIYTGSFDTNQIATSIEASDFAETDTAGIFGLEPDLGQGQYIAREEGWVVSSSNREETGDDGGDDDSKESSDDGGAGFGVVAALSLNSERIPPFTAGVNRVG